MSFTRFWRSYDGSSSVYSIISFPIRLASSLSVLVARPILGAKVGANVHVLVVSITVFNTFPEIEKTKQSKFYLSEVSCQGTMIRASSRETLTFVACEEQRRITFT